VSFHTLLLDAHRHAAQNGAQYTPCHSAVAASATSFEEEKKTSAKQKTDLNAQPAADSTSHVHHFPFQFHSSNNRVFVGSLIVCLPKP
jgi:hypothetical protein